MTACDVEEFKAPCLLSHGFMLHGPSRLHAIWSVKLVPVHVQYVSIVHTVYVHRDYKCMCHMQA